MTHGSSKTHPLKRHLCSDAGSRRGRRYRALYKFKSLRGQERPALTCYTFLSPPHPLLCSSTFLGWAPPPLCDNGSFLQAGLLARASPPWVMARFQQQAGRASALGNSVANQGSGG